jgi:nucleotide-binding universal stress UspA family protein
MPAAAVDWAVDLVALVGGKLSALATHVEIPVRSNWLADHLAHLGDLARGEEERSLAACRESLAHFTARAQAAGVFQEALVERASVYLVSELVARRARARDFCIMPRQVEMIGQEDVAQGVIFDSGRPVVVVKAQAGTYPPAKLDTVVVAWDSSRCAARAMADAAPLLVKARTVRVLTVVNDKPAAVKGLGIDAARHLRTLGVEAAVDEIDGAGRSTGAALDAYLAEHSADLLVMGAYGHSRLREFVLGGATWRMLKDPPLPVFMSH